MTFQQIDPIEQRQVTESVPTALSQSTLYSLLMQAPAILCVLRGSDHVFELVNPMYQRLFGGRELLGRPIREALPELEGQGYFELLDQVLTTGEPLFGKEAPVLLARAAEHDLEQRFFDFVYQPIVDQGRVTGVMVFGFEVTDMVLSRRQLDRLAENLRQANRDKDEFIAVVAHELRTPMTSILGWVRLLRLGGLDPRTQNEALEALERSTKAQAKIIEDLLDESRIATGKLRLDLRALDLAAVVRSAVEMVESIAAPKSIRLMTKIETGRFDMAGDPVRLQQAISNVVSNAIKFSHEGASVDVLLRDTGGFASLEVRDAGRGIEAELLPHIFGRFHQGDTPERRSGLGLGLTIARHLVELHGGTITATSEGEGKGAVFTLRLPLQKSDGAAAFVGRDEAGRASALPNLRDFRILVVEDDVDNRNVVAAVMERCGADVVCCGSAAEALEQIEQKLPDVIVADVALPDLNGVAFLEKLRSDPRSEVREIPALALTVFSRPIDTQRITAAGFDALKPKPIEPADLAHEIARLVRQRA